MNKEMMDKMILTNGEINPIVKVLLSETKDFIKTDGELLKNSINNFIDYIVKDVDNDSFINDFLKVDKLNVISTIEVSTNIDNILNKIKYFNKMYQDKMMKLQVVGRLASFISAYKNTKIHLVEGKIDELLNISPDTCLNLYLPKFEVKLATPNIETERITLFDIFPILLKIFYI
jgi:hypothetical protein